MRACGLISFAILLSAAPAAAAVPSFLRVDDVVSVDPGDVQLMTTVEGSRPWGTAPTGPGTGGYTGVLHRIEAHVGLPWGLQASLEANVRQMAASDFHSGSYVPQLTLELPGTTSITPFVGVGSRVRVQGSRPSTGMAVAGVAMHAGPVKATAQVSGEVDDGGVAGVRYEAGGAWTGLTNWAFGAEGWGVRTGEFAGGESAADRVGLSVRRTLGPMWLGGHCGVGRTELKSGTVTDNTCMIQAGWTR